MYLGKNRTERCSSICLLRVNYWPLFGSPLRLVYTCNLCCDFHSVIFISDGCERVDELRMFWVYVPSSELSKLMHSFTSIRRRTNYTYYKSQQIYCECKRTIIRLTKISDCWYTVLYLPNGRTDKVKVLFVADWPIDRMRQQIYEKRHCLLNLWMIYEVL
jgi:hypothetical protein